MATFFSYKTGKIRLTTNVIMFTSCRGKNVKLTDFAFRCSKNNKLIHVSKLESLYSSELKDVALNAPRWLSHRVHARGWGCKAAWCVPHKKENNLMKIKIPGHYFDLKSECVEKILPFLYMKVKDVLRAKQSLNELNGTNPTFFFLVQTKKHKKSQTQDIKMKKLNIY